MFQNAYRPIGLWIIATNVIKLKMLSIFISFSVPIFGQVQPSNKISDFVPPDYVIFEKITGDLNSDGIEDCVVITKETDTSRLVLNDQGVKVDRNRRGIIILFYNEGQYEMVLRNLECFPSENEDGGVYMAPDLYVEINEEKLIIHFSHGRYGYLEYIFAYQNPDFYCIHFNASSNRGPVVERMTSIDFLTYEKLEKVNINEKAEGDDEVFEETKSKIKVHSIRLSEIVDFDEVDMTIF